MSVIMTMHLKADAKKLEEIAGQDPDRIRSIADAAKGAGLIAHRFYGSDDGQVMVIDEWPDAQSFQRFFEEQSSKIQPLMEESGLQSEPEVTFWQKLETGDDVGWGA
jgi:heme-degrading monooxygenase HmoA